MKSQGILSTYTGKIIVANVVAFVGFLILQSSMDPNKAISLIALVPSTILAGEGLWTFITSMFMHAGFGHLFVNMISLMFIGGFVEKLIGKKRFLGLYFASGIFAGFFFVLIALATGTDLNVYAVGASGAIFGLGGLLAVLTPKLPVLVFFIIPMPMWAAMGFLIVVLWVLSLGLGLPIGNVAHLGGLLVGLSYGFYLKRKYPKKTKMISNHFAR
ncbi:rhomboid family intramembrane serine protease [Candidatus Pacearchaeota archaeon]|nr:rhomboid family intramembrane serine protease [Candidatus Pacearchaeota archaeon]